MHRVALFFHIYQPPTQSPAVTREITKNSYQRFTKILENSSRGRLTLNLTASLTEQLAKLGYVRLLRTWEELLQEGKIEMTATAAYHPLLPKLPPREIRRQIRLNARINRKYLPSYNPRGFFPPEMAYSPKLARVLAKEGYEWILVDESAYPAAKLEAEKEIRPDPYGLGKYVYQLPNKSVKVFFREREISLKVAFAESLTLEQFIEYLRKGFDEGEYVIIALDGETFGHHHHGNLRFLQELMETPKVELVTISQLLKLYPTRVVEPVTSTWGITRKEALKGRVFPRWDNPANLVHRLQWQLFNLALRVGEHRGSQSDLLDKALHSDQFWWAGHNPCWHPEMVEKGARMLMEVVKNSSRTSKDDCQQARKLYREIVETGREMFGMEVIPC